MLLLVYALFDGAIAPVADERQLPAPSPSGAGTPDIVYAPGAAGALIGV